MTTRNSATPSSWERRTIPTSHRVPMIAFIVGLLIIVNGLLLDLLDRHAALSFSSNSPNYEPSILDPAAAAAALVGIGVAALETWPGALTLVIATFGWAAMIIREEVRSLREV